MSAIDICIDFPLASPAARIEVPGKVPPLYWTVDVPLDDKTFRRMHLPIERFRMPDGSTRWVIVIDRREHEIVKALGIGEAA